MVVANITAFSAQCSDICTLAGLCDVRDLFWCCTELSAKRVRLRTTRVHNVVSKDS